MTYHEAITYPKWKLAMDQEFAALEANKTWEIVDLHPGKKAIRNKWVYKIKYHADGTMDKFKAILVAKYYTQKYGIDFHDIFSPVAKIVILRCLLSFATKLNWPLYQMDVTNAFLEGALDEDIYTVVPQGYEIKEESKVCRLLKYFYGLQPPSRKQNHKFASIMMSGGFP